MRTKRPAVVQKWVDSLPTIDNISEISNDQLVAAKTDTCRQSNSIETDTNEIDEKVSSSAATAVAIDEQLQELNIRTERITHSRSEAKERTEPIDTTPILTETTIKISDANESATKLEDSGKSTAASSENRFWQNTPSILSTLQLRTNLIASVASTTITTKKATSETNDLSASDKTSSQQLSCDETETISTNNTTSTSTKTTSTTTATTSSLLNKSKLNEFYNKLNISKKRFNFIKERKMEAKKILNNAKSRFLQSADGGMMAAINRENSKESDKFVSDNNDDDTNTVSAGDVAAAVDAAVVAAPDVVTTTSTSTSMVCDAIEMDFSDDYSRLSQSNDLLSVDGDDSFNVSMPSINEIPPPPPQHLSVNRKIAMGEIGRSTSDNPRLRNKFYLADIGRSFSEHQDDDAIIIGERNISAPSSSIAIQNNNNNNSKTNGNYFERRAYSVSPTQRSLKRGTLSRDHSLSDHSSRHRTQLSKGNSFQSDSSHCSSVESLLDARKPDPEAILRHLGFGPAHQEDLLSRIPKR